MGNRPVFAPAIDWNQFPEKFQKPKWRDRALCVIHSIGVMQTRWRPDEHDSDPYAGWVTMSAETGAAICGNRQAWTEVIAVLMRLGIVRRGGSYIPGEQSFCYEVPALRTNEGVAYEVSREAFGRIFPNRGKAKQSTELPHPYLKVKNSLPALKFNEKTTYRLIDEHFEIARASDPEKAEKDRVRSINLVRMHNSGSCDNAITIGPKSQRCFNAITGAHDWLRQQLETHEGEPVGETDTRCSQPSIDAVMAIQNTSVIANAFPDLSKQKSRGKGQSRGREEDNRGERVYDSNLLHEFFTNGSIEDMLRFNVELCESGEVYQWFADNVFGLPFVTDEEKRKVKRQWLITRFGEPHQVIKPMSKLWIANPGVAAWFTVTRSSELGPAATLQRREAEIMFGADGVIARLDREFPGVPAITAHDSSITPAESIGLASVDIQVKTFRDHGINIKVKHRRGGIDIV
jgi:hypothetical protein